MLFQLGALFTDLSVFDNVAFQMREHTDLPEPMIRDGLRLPRPSAFVEPRPMPAQRREEWRRRVALALSMLDPVLIMYDEPFTGLFDRYDHR